MSTESGQTQKSFHQLIKDVGTAWLASHPSDPRLQFGDISLSGGGPFPGHNSHQNGLDGDFRYLRNDGNEGMLNVLSQASTYSESLTIDLLNAVADVSAGRVEFIEISDHANIDQLEVPGVPLVIDSSGVHDDHFHVRMKDPDGSDANNCP